MPPPGQLRTRRPGPLAITVTALVVLAGVLAAASQFWTEVLWYDSVGYARVLWTRLGTQVALFLLDDGRDRDVGFPAVWHPPIMTRRLCHGRAGGAASQVAGRPGWRHSSQAAKGASTSTAPHRLPSATRRLSSPPRTVIQRRVRKPAAP